ncbi:MAG: hypothetical protein HDR88_00195 [Bacteroides sp.]|nr:hypothetical protein [Bacteroides sp.]
MRKFLIVIFAMMAMVLPSFAQEKNGDSSSKNIKLELHNHPDNSSILRAPMLIGIEAYYNADTQTIDIIYDGEAEGEVFLYLNNAVVDYATEINTSFSISVPGFYKIEINGETWTAEGYLEV